MSTTRTVYILCDGDPDGTLCDEDYYIQGGSEVTEAKVRAEAIKHGWQRTKDCLDLCPIHRTDILINQIAAQS